MKSFTCLAFLLMSFSVYGQVPRTDAMVRNWGDKGQVSSQRCTDVSNEQAECSFSWNDPSENLETGHSIAITSFGPLKGVATATVNGYVAAKEIGSFSGADEWAYDTISFDNLTVPAFVRVEGSTSYKLSGSGKASVRYSVNLGLHGCEVNNETVEHTCTFKTPVKPGDTMRLERTLFSSLMVRLTNFPSGSEKNGSVSVGFPPDDGDGATMKLFVVGNDGRPIEGVNVVGKSGHVYAQQ
jgi:hypothetical protein